ncbi:rab-GTPase-TBC domain-containing protein [Cercophora newfieldiana]|uniref:Rab-GTPase-TBC domain-containing protein n=1 Tax=Cercophora newfieldiana TaxID=92897 RepID=A0AA39Y7Q7_9PEZI|nr:rab-GTPase-TBC domain-containing protein [Cercophora newfieldiana]
MEVTMRSYSESKARWEETLRHGTSIADLQRAVKFNGPTSPCVAGSRSVCWKAFLLFRDAPFSHWPLVLAESRSLYDSLCAQHLQYIRHPEQLAALSFDPLADDPDSPWDTVRRDEIARAEIHQDVRRLPDDPFYHEEAVQSMILDILFLYCKLNPGVGGYRQGMHELLGPIVQVVARDAVDRNAATMDDSADPTMIDILDARYIEHDSYAIFSHLMGRASAFYEVGSGSESTNPGKNTIVEKSQYIHEVALMKVDQELANHLRNIEVLPQIFLIRWIRLLFGREFPFEQLLSLWDNIFAFDPNLDLIDLICVAMLLRIRWTLLEADYSVALQLMLKYPAPLPPHGPHTFVDDAIYLRDHPNAAGGVTLIFKYTGRSPTAPTQTQKSSAPPLQGFGSLRQRTLGARSPLSSTARLLQQPGGVEALLQGATKNMMERGEKLGINQAVRDAVGEIRRNMQGFQEARSPGRGRGISFGDSRPVSSDYVTILERRNRRLGAMLEESVDNLKRLATSKLEGDKDQAIEALEIAAAKVQFVKTCLEDWSLSLPDDNLPAMNTLTISSPTDIRSPTVALDTTPVVMTSLAVGEARSTLSSPDRDPLTRGLPTLPEEADPAPETATPAIDKMDTDEAPEPVTLSTSRSSAAATPISTPRSIPTAVATDPSAPSTPKERPKGPIPTRSTLAQSSFSWMLEPDTTLSSAHNAFPTSRPSSSGSASAAAHKKRNNPSRERNAFLFGEVVSSEGIDERKLSADEIFGLQPIRK